jgi:hypothetical protein
VPVPPPITGTNPQPPAPVTAPVATSVTVTPTQLPFTGRNIKPFLFTGLVLVSVGLALLAPSEFWRRRSRRLTTIVASGVRWVSATWMGRSSIYVRLRGAPSMVGCSFFGL